MNNENNNNKKVFTEDAKSSVNTAVNNMTYEGIVNIKYLTASGKEIKFRGKNEGLNAMFKYLCKALSGNFTNISAEKPAYFDIRCIYKDENGVENSISCLYNKLSISNPEYFYDSALYTWVTRFSIALSYNMLNFNVIDKYLADETARFYTYIVSAKGNDFARLNITDSNLLLTQLVPGTQALIEWSMIIENKKKSS